MIINTGRIPGTFIFKDSERGPDFNMVHEIKITKKEPRIRNQKFHSVIGFWSNNDSVHFVAAIATGDADGNSNMGINTSRNSACKVMPEIKQPTETMAPVPKKRISENWKNEKLAGRFKKMKKGTMNKISDIKTKKSAEITFDI